MGKLESTIKSEIERLAKRWAAFMTQLVSNVFSGGLIIMDFGETKMKFLNLGLIEIPILFGRIFLSFKKRSSWCMCLLFCSMGD